MKFSIIFNYLLLWRIGLFLILFFALSFLPTQFNFLGGGLTSYLHNPYLWSWINFDGEHYLSIAQNGYKPLEYFFFPFYPIVVEFFSKFLGATTFNYAVSGLLVSHIAFVFGIVGFVKLIQLDYSENIAKTAIFLLLLFPTSFYFATYYTESLFFSLIVWAFYFARKDMWLFAGILGAFACATRIVGVALLPAFFIEAYVHKREILSKQMFGAFFASLFAAVGILLYMRFLDQRTGDPFAFFTSLNYVYGEQRSDSFILLPQVFYRYFFNILPSIDYRFFPLVFVTYLEILTAIIFLILTFFSIFKLRFSYTVFMLAGYIIPTLSDSFSSFPRYVLVLFPAFILSAMYVSKLPRILSTSLYILFAVLLVLAQSYFLRGYWIS